MLGLEKQEVAAAADSLRPRIVYDKHHGANAPSTEPIRVISLKNPVSRPPGVLPVVRSRSISPEVRLDGSKDFPKGHSGHVVEGFGLSPSGALHVDLLHHCRSNAVRSRAPPHTASNDTRGESQSLSCVAIRVQGDLVALSDRLERGARFDPQKAFEPFHDASLLAPSVAASL